MSYSILKNAGGVVADFHTGYLAKATPLHQATVAGGLDVSYDGAPTGYATGRLVTVTIGSDGSATITLPTSGVGAIVTGAAAGKYSDATHPVVLTAGLGNANAIIAQSDNTLGTIDQKIAVERYTSRYEGILGNSTDKKVVSIYKIVNADDIKIIPVAPTTDSVRR